MYRFIQNEAAMFDINHTRFYIRTNTLISVKNTLQPQAYRRTEYKP